MVKIRLIFIKRFASFDAKDAKTSALQKRNRPKKYLDWLIQWNEMVQSSLKWLLGSSRRYKRLTWRSQGQLHLRLWFCSNYKKRTNFIVHTPTHGAILRYESIIDKVSLKLHKASSKTFCLDTVNFFFYSPSNEKANFPCQFSPSVHNSTVISRVTNQYLKWLFSYSNHPSSFKT